MKHPLIVFVLLSLLSGCSSPDYHAKSYSERFKQHGYSYTPKSDITEHTQHHKVSSGVLQKYAMRLSYELAQQVDVRTLPPILVASFVNFDQSLKHSNALGNTLAEDLQTALRQHGFKVTERHANSKIESDRFGTYVLNNTASTPERVTYVLTGTIQYNAKSALINSRLMAVNDGTIIAAYTLPIPNFMLQHAFPLLEGQDIVIKTK